MANQTLNSVQTVFATRYPIVFQPILSRSAACSQATASDEGTRLLDLLGEQVARQAALQSPEPARAPSPEGDDDDAHEGDGEHRTRAEEEQREGDTEGDERAPEEEVRQLGVGPSREWLASDAERRAPNRRHLRVREP